MTLRGQQVLASDLAESLNELGIEDVDALVILDALASCDPPAALVRAPVGNPASSALLDMLGREEAPA